MNRIISDIMKNLQDNLSKVEKSFKELEKELELTRLERDIYKEIVLKSQNSSIYSSDSNVVYVAIYSRDNGEGRDTDICIGVFTTKTKALKAILDVCKSNTELSVNGFGIDEFNLDKELQTGNNVYVVKCDEEEHCEISTTILDIKCDNNTDDYKDCYSEEYTIDKVYHIE